jgi:hypothetical protein
MQQAEQTTCKMATWYMQHENMHPATRKTDRVQQTTRNLQNRGHATDICKKDEMQQEFTMRNRRDATCSMQHATQTCCQLEDATSETGKMQQTELQHAPCKKQVAACYFGLQRATCEAHTGGCRKQHAARTKDSTATDKMQLAKKTTCNRHAACKKDDMRQEPDACNRQHPTNSKNATGKQTATRNLHTRQRPACSMQHRQRATAGMQRAKQTTRDSQAKQVSCNRNSMHATDGMQQRRPATGIQHAQQPRCNLQHATRNTGKKQDAACRMQT